MRGPRTLPILVKRINLVWYAVALLPIVAFTYFGLTSDWWILALLAIFCMVFWVVSLVFAIWRLLNPPRELRQ